MFLLNFTANPRRNTHYDRSRRNFHVLHHHGTRSNDRILTYFHSIVDDGPITYQTTITYLHSMTQHSVGNDYAVANKNICIAMNDRIILNISVFANCYFSAAVAGVACSV